MIFSPSISLSVVISSLTVLQLVPSGSTIPKQIKLSKHPVLLVVSYDGFRYDYLTKTATPHLDALKAEGVSVPYMEAQFPTKTFPNHQSISTGLFPESHGITDNTVFDPQLNKTLSGFNDEPEFWNFHQDVHPIWIRNEQAGDGRVSGCYMWPGSPYGYGSNSSLFPHYVIPKYDSSVPWEARVSSVISWMTDETRPANLVFLYYNEPDSQGHAFGTEDNMTLAEIRKTDNRTGYLVQQLQEAGIYDFINLIILGDHGMQTVHSQNIINITAMADKSLYTRHGGSPVYQIQPNENSLDILYDIFKNHSAHQNFTVYKKEEMGLLKFTNNRRIMDLVLLAEEGYGFDDIQLNEKGVYGVHGYDNSSINMRTVFIARGPLFKRGFESKTFISNIDLFPLFCEIMSISCPPNNGTISIVSQFLVQNPASTTTEDFKSTTHGSATSIKLSLQLLVSVICIAKWTASVIES